MGRGRAKWTRKKFTKLEVCLRGWSKAGEAHLKLAGRSGGRPVGVASGRT
jgi:hypothetical protein